MRIAEMLIVPVPEVEIVEVEDPDETTRGRGGFGHGTTEVRNESEFERDALQWWTVFTGIIEQSVPVANIVDGPRFKPTTIPNPWPDVPWRRINLRKRLLSDGGGDDGGEIGFYVVIETLSRTNLGLLRNGDRVHLDRRFGRRSDRRAFCPGTCRREHCPHQSAFTSRRDGQ